LKVEKVILTATCTTHTHTRARACTHALTHKYMNTQTMPTLSILLSTNRHTAL